MKGTPRALFLIAIAAIALLGLLGATIRSAHRAPGPELTPQGERLWNFEALLAREFPGHRFVSVSGPELNFSCVRNCFPHARYRGWSFTFRNPTSDTYHVSKRTLRNVAFGNFPMVVRVRGHAVACDRHEKRFLIAYSDAVKRDLDCMPIGDR